MILIRFDKEKLGDCKTVTDVFRMMGVGLAEDDSVDLHFDNEAVFGKKASYRNMIISSNTCDEIARKFAGTSKEFLWWNIAPITEKDAPKEIFDAVGEIIDDVLYIITPQDKFYTEARG